MTIRVFGGQSSYEGPITLINYQNFLNNVTQNTLTIPAPTNTTGDYLIAYVYTADSGANPTTGSWTATGWTRLFNGSKLPNLDIYYKIAGNEPSSYTFTFSRSNFYLGGVIFSYRNVADIGFIGSTNISSGSYTSQTAPAGSANYTKALFLASFLNTNDGLSINLPAGYDPLFATSGGGGFGSLAIGGTGTGVSVAIGTKTSSTFDITSATATLSGTSSDSAESSHLYLIGKDKVTTLDSTSYNFGTVAPGSTTKPEMPTGVLITNVPTSPDNLVTPPSGVSFAIGTGPTTFGAWANTTTNYTTQNRTIAENNYIKFRVDTVTSTPDVTQSPVITVGTTKFTLTYDTNTFSVYTTPGTFTFTVPTGVTSMSMMAIGAGGGGRGGLGAEGPGYGGAGGGACSYTNNLAVTPGSTLTIRVAFGGTGGGLGVGGTDGGASWVSKTGVAPTSDAEGVLARGGQGKSGTTAAGAAGGATTGFGLVKYAGGNGATTVNTYGNGESGGGGGGAATPAGAGPTPAWDALQNGYITGGKAGRGTSVSSSGWGTVAAAWNSAYNGGNGQQRGGGGGSAYQSTVNTNYPNGGDGGGGAVVLIWNNRTFSAGTTY